MKKRFYRKGYFFILDAMIALTVVGLGAVLLFSSYANAPIEGQASLYSDDVMGFFANTKIIEVNNEYAGYQGTLWQQGKIDNYGNTLLQQTAIFYAKGNLATAESFIGNLTYNIIPEQYLFEMWIDNTLLYPLNPTSSHIASKNKTKVILPSHKLVHGFIDQEKGQTFGPFMAEVLVWQNQ